MPLPDFIPYTDEELKEKQLGPYASGASAPSIAGANAPVQTPVAQTPEDLSQLELVPYTGDELVTAVEGDITKQLTFGEFEKYRKAKSLEPEKTWNQRMSEFGEGAQMAGEEFFGGIWSAASQGFYITDPEKGIKTLASAFARGGVDMFTIFEDIFSKDFYAADTYEDFLEDMDWTDDEYSRKIYVDELSKDKVRFNLKRAFMAEREKWRKGESKTILPFVGEIEGEDVKGAEGFGYLTDFTVAVPGLSAFTKIPSAAAKGVGKVGNLGGKVVGGIGRTGTQISDKVAEQVGKVIPDASTTTTRVATIAGAGVTGQPLIGAALLVPEASKALDLSGRLGQKISQELGKRPSQFGVLERVAMNSSVDPQIRKLARILNAGGIGDKLLSGSGSLALGVGTGMVVGGVLGGLAQGDDGFWQGAGGGFAVGGPASLGGVGLSKLTGHARRSAEDADIMRFLESQAEKGVDPKQALDKLKRDGVLKIATLAKVFQGDVRVNLLDNAGYAKAHRAGAAAWNKDTKTIDINMDAADAKHNVLHEFGHAIFDSPVVNKNEIAAEINRIYGDSVVDGMATSYVEKLAENRFLNQHFKNNPKSKLAGDALAAWKQGKTFKNARGQTVKAADYELSVKMERQDQIAQHGMDWVVSEIFAEDFVGATVDRNINSLRKGKSHPSFFHLAGHILRTKANVFSRMGGKINEHGIVDGKYASRIFGEMTGDKKFKKTLRNYIRDRGRHFDELARRTRKKDGAGPKEDITRMGDHAGFWRDRGDGTFENDFAIKNAKGEVTIKDAEQIAQDLHNRAESVRKLRDALVARGVIGREDKRGLGARLNEKGDVEVSGQILPDDVIDSLDLPQQMKDQLKVLNNLVKNTGTAMVWYNGISTAKNGRMSDVIKTTKDGTPDLRGTTRMWRRNLRKFMGNIKSTRREIKPIGYTITKEGNITVELVDIDAIHDKVHRWQKDTDKNGRPKLELWGNDVGKFYDDLKVYMQNHRDGLGGAEGIGEAKRNAFRAFLMRDMTGSGGISPMHDILNNRSVDRTSMVKSFRLDRIGSVDGTMRDDFHFDYYKVKENLMPDGTPKVKEHGQTIEFNEAMGERFMPVAPEGARYMDLRDMQQEKMVALTIDRLGHGVRTLPSGAKTELAAQGGRAFMWLEKKWASYTAGPFSTLIGHLKDVGTEYIALTTLGELNHNNTRSGMRYFGESIRDAVNRGDITENQGDAYVKHILDATANLGPMRTKAAQAERAALLEIDTVQKFIDAVDEGVLTNKSGEQLSKQRKTKGVQHGIRTTEAEALGFGPTATARMAVDKGLWDETKFPVGTIVAVMKLKHEAEIMHEPSLHYHYPYTVDVEPVAYLKEFYPLSSLSRGESRALDKHGKPTGGNVFYKDNPRFADGDISPRGLQAIAPELDLLTEGKMGPPIDHPVNFMPETHWSNRDPILEKARKAGMSGEEWDNLVDLRRPVTMAPKPERRDLLPDDGPTAKEVSAAAKKFKKGDKELTTSLAMLNEKQRKLIGATRQTPEGTKVGVRLDIPFFQNTLKRFKEGVLNKVGYAITIHKQGTDGGVGDVMGYDTIARVKNAVFHVVKGMATANNDIEGIAAGTRSKFPNATVEGEYVSIHDKNGRLNDNAIPEDIYNDSNWIQVGFDPRRHEYFYRKDNTSVPIESASEAILVGNTAFVRVDDALVQGDRSQHRYMPAQTAKLESDYMSAVEKQDVDTMQSLVDQAAVRAGFNNDTVYHGTPTGEFTKFDKDLGGTGPISGNPIAKHGFFFAPDSEYAKKYAGPEGKVIQTKLSYSNPYKQNMWAMREIENAQGVATEDGVAAYMDKVKAEGHDAIELTNGEGGAVVESMVFNPNQIKSTDPVTFDDNGNVIPLHDRFNLDSDDIRYIPAYHGTPHTFAAEEGAPLGRFSTEKIGSGEGAQAYGYGLYFAEKKSIAEWYRDKLTKIDVDSITVNLKVNGKEINKTPKLKGDWFKWAWFNDDGKRPSKKDATDAALFEIENDVKNFAVEKANEGGKTISSDTAKFKAQEFLYERKLYIEDKLARLKTEWTRINRRGESTEVHDASIKDYELADEVLDDISFKMDFEIDMPSTQKSLYEVDITPKEEHFLDLDKDYNSQSDYVKDALDTLGLLLPDGSAAYDGYRKYIGIHKYEQPKESYYEVRDPSLSFVKTMERAIGPKKTSELLAQSGIAGNRFQDSPTRSAIRLGKPGKQFKPTYNYVVFQDSAVEIKNRYMPRVSEDGKVITIPTKGRIVKTGPTKFRAYNMNGKLLGVAGSQGAADALLNRQKK